MLSFVLTHFDQKLGPRIFLSLPEKALDAELAKRIENFMDLDFGDSCFEINLSDTEFRTFNNIINLPSKKSRGYVESFLLSIIADKHYNSEIMFNFLKDVNDKFVNYIDILDDMTVSQDKVKEILVDCRISLESLLNEYKSDTTNLEKIESKEDFVVFLSTNLQKLANHIAGKNEFNIQKFLLKETTRGHYSIQIDLKGGGFLTGPLKKMTVKSVYDGVEKYMLSNGILKGNFEIKIK